jgi:hypothetical protein
MMSIKNILFTVMALLVYTQANAIIITVDSGGAIIDAPTFVFDDAVFNTGQKGFNEKQGVILGAALDTDDGVGAIAAGTAVDSHMIFLNQGSGTTGTISHLNVTWTFSGMILGVMSDRPGTLEAMSNMVLGADGTSYPASFDFRGLENNDSYSVAGNTLTLSMYVSQPGDWIRVVTAAVPEPGSLLLIVVGLFGLALNRRIVTQ